MLDIRHVILWSFTVDSRASMNSMCSQYLNILLYIVLSDRYRDATAGKMLEDIGSDLIAYRSDKDVSVLWLSNYEKCFFFSPKKNLVGVNGKWMETLFSEDFIES